MAETIKQIEAAPAAYPSPPDGLSEAAQALDADAIWQRIEAFIAWRFSEREVTWIVEGPGQWEPPLAPATVTKAEIWRSETWDELTLPTAPLGGFMLSGEGPYRLTATVGDDEAEVPATVLEAFRRLAEYMAARKPEKGGVTFERIEAGSVSIARRMSPAAAAEAMANSGAGDLLRPYRRA